MFPYIDSVLASFSVYSLLLWPSGKQDPATSRFPGDKEAGPRRLSQVNILLAKVVEIRAKLKL